MNSSFEGENNAIDQGTHLEERATNKEAPETSPGPEVRLETARARRRIDNDVDV